MASLEGAILIRAEKMINLSQLLFTCIAEGVYFDVLYLGCFCTIILSDASIISKARLPSMKHKIVS